VKYELTISMPLWLRTTLFNQANLQRYSGAIAVKSRFHAHCDPFIVQLMSAISETPSVSRKASPIEAVPANDAWPARRPLFRLVHRPLFQSAKSGQERIPVPDARRDESKRQIEQPHAMSACLLKSIHVMAGLVPAIHVFRPLHTQPRLGCPAQGREWRRRGARVVLICFDRDLL
jgi:hypothetical protein